MRYKLKKLYQEWKAQIRDYDVQKCVKDQINMEIEFDNEIMTLTPSQLSREILHVSSTFKSKNKNGKDYKLLTYKWNPDTKKI